MTEPEYHDGRGAPASLPFDGDEPSFSTLVIPVATSSTVAMGVSNAMPNTSTTIMTKLTYCVMSGW